MSSFEELAGRLRSGAKADMISAAHALGDLGDARAVEPLIELLRHDDPAIRDAAAVGLREIGDPRAVTTLLEMIADPKTEGHRGTLVYALSGLDCSGILPELVQLVIDGNFEVSRQAFLAIESIDCEIPTATLERARGRVEEALKTAADDKRELLQELLDLLASAE